MIVRVKMEKAMMRKRNMKNKKEIMTDINRIVYLYE
jgi:hypothetical protein